MVVEASSFGSASGSEKKPAATGANSEHLAVVLALYPSPLFLCVNSNRQPDEPQSTIHRLAFNSKRGRAPGSTSFTGTRSESDC